VSGGGEHPGHTRRSLLAATGVAAAGLAACGDDDGDGRAGRELDAVLMNIALDSEHALVAAYAAGVRRLRGRSRRTARAFLAHEREHVRIVAREVRRLGGKPHEAKLPEDYRRGYPALERQGDVLRFLVDLEGAAVRAYQDALPKLSSPRLRRLAGSLATTEAEHSSILLAAAGRSPLPEAFVTGKS
jgi:rubrerythrin